MRGLLLLLLLLLPPPLPFPLSRPAPPPPRAPAPRPLPPSRSIDKAPHTKTPTPFHQDQAYWPDLEDTNAVSVWVSLDHALLASGCMWYGPGTHRGAPCPHARCAEGVAGAALQCVGSEEECVYMELPPGAAGLHAGGTLHYSRGNNTGGHRRAYIMNFRPYTMICALRSQGFAHGRAGHIHGGEAGEP